MSHSVTAGMPLPLLVDKLARVGGGGLERRQVAALTALARTLPRKSGSGFATAQQLADRANYSGRWMREALAELEAAGVVEWERGGVSFGRPTPSWFRVSKRALVELIRGGVDELAALLARRAAETSARLAGLWHVRTRRRGQTRTSAHAEVSAHPMPCGEDTGVITAVSSVPSELSDPVATTARGAAAARAALAAVRTARPRPGRVIDA